jgi:hypothetical protein
VIKIRVDATTANRMARTPVQGGFWLVGGRSTQRADNSRATLQLFPQRVTDRLVDAPAGQIGGIELLRNDGFKIDTAGGFKVTDS